MILDYVQKELFSPPPHCPTPFPHFPSRHSTASQTSPHSQTLSNALSFGLCYPVLFSESSCFLSCLFPFLWNQIRWSLNCPICFFFLVSPSAPPPTSFPPLGSCSLAPATPLLQELKLPSTESHFCSSRKVLFRKLPHVYSHFGFQQEQCLEAAAGVETEGWCWGA